MVLSDKSNIDMMDYQYIVLILIVVDGALGQYLKRLKKN